MSKSLGQVFYNAFNLTAKQFGMGNSVPWEDLPIDEQVCAEAAAQAVRAAVLADVPEIPK
jgi:hypothetical protein